MSDTLERQKREWERRVQLGKQGNPFATLCNNCYGRHAPPNDELCPHENIEVTKARLKRKLRTPTSTAEPT